MKPSSQKAGIGAEEEGCSLSLFECVCALVWLYYLLLHDCAQFSLYGLCLFPCTNLLSEPLFFLVVQCVAHALFTARYSNPAMETELFISLWALLGHWWQALANLFFTVPVWGVGVVLCLVYGRYLRQREIRFKSIHRFWFWTRCVRGHGPMQRCSVSEPGCLQIQSGVRNSADEECIFSDHLGIFYLSDSPNSAQQFCGSGKDFTGIFPGQFSAALTDSLSNFLLNSLHASHLLQPME